MTSILKERQLVSIPPLNPQNFQKLIPNRFDTIHLYDDNDKIAPPRYQLIVLDRPLVKKSELQSITHPVAVFLIPAGRESEYLFRTYTGLKDIAESADCARLIVVSFHREHVYDGGQKMVQEELKVAVQIIAQQGSFMYLNPTEREWYLNKQKQQNSLTKLSFSIPFMALDGIGKRDVIVKGDSPTTGPFFVEQVKVDGSNTVRRLYFQENENVIQTEVFVKQLSTDTNAMVVDMWKLAFDYHQHLAAGILVLGGYLSSLSLNKELEKQQQGMVIGLGGGALVNFFKLFFSSIQLTVVELDQCIVDIAQSHFDFRKDDKDVNVIIGDGLLICAETATSSTSTSAVEGDNDNKEESGSSISKSTTTNRDNTKEAIEFIPNSMKFIVIDVDSKDTSVGMSCPPESFVIPMYLLKLQNVLTHDGILAINVSARDPSMLQIVKKNVQQVFESVFLSSSTTATDDDTAGGEDLNVVLFCTKSNDCNSFLLEQMKNPSLQQFFEVNNHDTEGPDEDLSSELEECICGIKSLNVVTTKISAETMTLENSETQKKQNTKKKKSSKSSKGKKKGGNKKKKKNSRKK